MVQVEWDLEVNIWASLHHMVELPGSNWKLNSRAHKNKNNDIALGLANSEKWSLLTFEDMINSKIIKHKTHKFQPS